MSSNNGSNTTWLGWVSPNEPQRSSWDIIWSCFTVFLVCSWKCTHLNIPSDAESKGSWHKFYGVPYWPEPPTWRKWGRKLGFMAISAIAPEVVVGIAAKEFATAWMDVRALDNRKFTMTHAFFAQMGGFVLQVRNAPSPESLKAEDGGDARPVGESMQAGVVVTRAVLNLRGVAALNDAGLSFNLEEEDIQDRSKADGFTKAFALVQAGWLVVQSIARHAAGLQISELELVTLAFILCALITYLLWWYKPFDVDRSIILKCQDTDARLSQAQMFLSGADQQNGSIRNEFLIDSTHSRVTQLSDGQFPDLLFTIADVFNHNSIVSWDGSLFGSISCSLCSAAFSAVHLAAWSWQFPHSVVGTLWRAFSLAAFVSALSPFLLSVLTALTSRGPFKDVGMFYGGMAFLGLFTNAASRLMLIGLTVYCFSSMPAGVYTNLDWTQWFPHFG